ncbi:CheY chemotaxis protein or a CheY-like REC (receiver) domain [Algoriphagus ornithinivorans]|uniref:CheY chemotaxis protein or a CheY-like REC (Receiver) domain n=2 Tax=Algoriphagus ornithinivorans TaxID=226506 RepID=A0A1I5BRR6_9BACT|nr:CheY chemotaxis protein or a CheY-like REC (receiver) domain [Algoriphagus ornithinivorans]
MRQAKILLVEDNDGDIFLTLEAFEESKIKTQINVVKNGEDALDFLYQRGEFKDAFKPDLILLDINIPLLNGHEVLKDIKSNKILKKIPVIMLTTSSNKVDIEKAYSNHVNSFVTKPIQMDDFLSAILKIEEFWLNLCTLSE